VRIWRGNVGIAVAEKIRRSQPYITHALGSGVLQGQRIERGQLNAARQVRHAATHNIIGAQRQGRGNPYEITKIIRYGADKWIGNKIWSAGRSSKERCKC